MKNKNDVDVLINGKQYTLAGFESEEYLQKVATYINGKYNEFKKQEYYSGLDMDLKNVLMSINIADDYFKAQKRARELEAENELKDKMVFDMKHEIITMQEKTEKALKQVAEIQAAAKKAAEDEARKKAEESAKAESAKAQENAAELNVSLDTSKSEDMSTLGTPNTNRNSKNNKRGGRR